MFVYNDEYLLNWSWAFMITAHPLAHSRFGHDQMRLIYSYWDCFYFVRFGSFSCGKFELASPRDFGATLDARSIPVINNMAPNNNHTNSATEAAMPHHRSRNPNYKGNKIQTSTLPTTMSQLRKPGGDRKTVAYAVNYEASLVDRFFASSCSTNGGESHVGFHAVQVLSVESSEYPLWGYTAKLSVNMTDLSHLTLVLFCL